MQLGYVLLGLVSLTSLHVSSGQCSNGLAGFQRDDICCDAGCGTCGGRGCADLLGGRTFCCSNWIRNFDQKCSDTMSAPCVIDDDGPEQPTCENGLTGVQSNSICCAAECGTCGGAGCSQRPGGADACCSSTIRTTGGVCSATMEAPCVIDNGEGAQLCSNGLPGIQEEGSCCEAQCGTCGGAGCGQRPGGKSGCCTSRIQASNIYCTVTNAAPCMVYSEADDDDDY